MNKIHVNLWPLCHTSLSFLATEFREECLSYHQLSALSNVLNEGADRSGMFVVRKDLIQLQGLSDKCCVIPSCQKSFFFYFIIH